MPAVDLSATLTRWPVWVDDLLRSTPEQAKRGECLAARLRESWPTAAASGCLLCGDAETACLLDRAGQPHPAWQELFRQSWTQNPSPRATLPLPPAWQLPSHSLLMQELRAGTQRYGMLVLVLADETTAGAFPEAESFLHIGAELLAARLQLEIQQRQLEELRTTLAAQLWLANLGEIAGPLAHEFSNFLNVLMLQLSLMQSDMPERQRGDLAELRRQGNQAVQLIRQWQNYRHGRRPPAGKVELNRIIREVVQEIGAAEGATGFPPIVPIMDIQAPAPGVLERPGVPVFLMLTPDLPAVPGPAADWQRLLRFLLAQGLNAAASNGGTVTLRTERAENQVRLRIEDSGPNIDSAALAHLFDMTGPSREGSIPLEMAACRIIVRRMQGRIHGESRAEGGLAMVAEVPVA